MGARHMHPRRAVRRWAMPVGGDVDAPGIERRNQIGEGHDAPGSCQPPQRARAFATGSPAIAVTEPLAMRISVLSVAVSVPIGVFPA